ncbi:MAG: ribonuclease D [Oceanospirillaceae bacterium]
MQPNSYDWQQLEASALKPIYLDTHEALEERCRHWLKLPMISIDTEFQRVDTFYPIAGLIQVGDDQQCYLIDPLKISDYKALIEVFEAPSVLKIIHAGSEDLELFRQLIGVVPKPLYDTQIAAAFLGWGFTMGLQRLLEQVLDIKIGKAETTSNWLQRPLTNKQELYAALDVAYLPEVCQRQIKQMQDRDCYKWFLEDSVKTVEKVAQVDDEVDSENYYLRFGQMWSLPDYKLVALKALSCWREVECRRRNMPRNWVLKNQTIIAIINQWPASVSTLSKADDIRGKNIREDGDDILQILSSAKELLAEKGTVAPIKKPLDPIWNKRFKKIKQIAITAAAEQGVVPEIVLRKKDLEALVRTKEEFGEYKIPNSLKGWREQLFGLEILAQMQHFD